jgi:hypothetical protein
LSVLRRASPSRSAASPVDQPREDVFDRVALELADPARLSNTVARPVAGDELVEGLLAVRDGGEHASHSIGVEMTAVETSQGAP